MNSRDKNASAMTIIWLLVLGRLPILRTFRREEWILYIRWLR